MNKDILLKALYNILDSYDAYFMVNKYSDMLDYRCTHYNEFKTLYKLCEIKELNSAYIKRLLMSIRYNYDCYYKNEEACDKESPFLELKNIIEGLSNE